jgi:hypothetical protein
LHPCHCRQTVTQRNLKVGILCDFLTQQSLQQQFLPLKAPWCQPEGLEKKRLSDFQAEMSSAVLILVDEKIRG